MADNDQQQDERCVTVIFNPKSGQEDPEQRKAGISEALAAHGYTCQYVVTTPEQGAQHYATEALRHGADVLAVSGGDGTVVEAMSALIGTDVPIAVFPAGTGNLLSINLGISKDVQEAARAALRGERRRLDLGRITFDSGECKHFAIMAGAGYDAQVISEADREAKDKLGLFAYVWAGITNLGRRSVRVSVYLDDHPQPIRRRVKSVMIANMGQLQGGLDLVPDAHPDDGMLNVVLLKAERLRDWLQLVAGVVTHTVEKTPSIEYHQARRVTVKLSRPEPVQFDGEEATTAQSFTVEVLPAAVLVMVPSESDL